MASKSEILQNAREVLKRAEQIVSYLEKNNHDEPSLKPTSCSIPNDAAYEALRIPLNNAAEELLRLVNGPLNWLRLFFCTHHDLAAWQVALDFEFFKAVPLEGSISLSEMAKVVGMDEDRIGRVMRLLVTQRVFVEVETDMFQHNATSALIAKDEAINAVIAMQYVIWAYSSAKPTE